MKNGPLPDLVKGDAIDVQVHGDMATSMAAISEAAGKAGHVVAKATSNEVEIHAKGTATWSKSWILVARPTSESARTSGIHFETFRKRHWTDASRLTRQKETWGEEHRLVRGVLQQMRLSVDIPQDLQRTIPTRAIVRHAMEAALVFVSIITVAFVLPRIL